MSKINVSASVEASIAMEDITPSPGIILTGYAVRVAPFAMIDSPIRCSVLAIRDDRGTVVLIIAADLVIADIAHVNNFRDACAHAAGITRDQVMVNLSHSHSTPAIGIYTSVYDEAQQLLHQAYWDKVTKAGIAASKRALAELRPAKIGYHFGECQGNVNRRQHSPQGDIVIGENPSGPCDSSVGVIRIDNLNGDPLAVAFRYSCHPVTLGPNTNQVSPDFVAPARDAIEKALGCPSIFLQGCGGNINPASGIGQDGNDSPYTHDLQRRLGLELAGEVIKVASKIDNFRERTLEPEFVESVGRYWMYPRREIENSDPISIRIREELLELELTRLPGVEELDYEVDEWKARCEELVNENAPAWKLGPVNRFSHWAKIRRQALDSGANPPRIEVPLQEIQIGDLRICAIPFEAMAETGLSIRSALGEGTFVLGFTNGILSYLPTPEISSAGGMEAKLGYKSYLVPTEIPGDCETAIVRWFTKRVEPAVQ